MTREEKQKVINALKISAPVMTVTQEEFNDYIQALNQVMDWLEQELCEDTISRQAAIRLAEQGRVQGFEWQLKELVKLPSVSTEKLAKAKSEIRYGENKAYNADFTMGCEYAISVIERMFEEVEE